MLGGESSSGCRWTVGGGVVEGLWIWIWTIGDWGLDACMEERTVLVGAIWTLYERLDREFENTLPYKASEYNNKTSLLNLGRDNRGG